MGLLDRERWHRLRPHLERALDAAPEERTTMLDALAAEDPEAARVLRDWLDEQARLDSAGFLEREFARPELPASSPAREGARVGAYTIERLLGRGGMGEVWLASRHDGRFEGRCAIKWLDVRGRPGLSAERFAREGRLLGRLDHPHIARLLDAGTVDGHSYLALESRGVVGIRDLVTARLLAGVASLDLGDPVSARGQLAPALTASEQLTPLDTPERAELWEALARTYETAGDAVTAKTFAARAAAFWRSHRGDTAGVLARWRREP